MYAGINVVRWMCVGGIVGLVNTRLESQWVIGGGRRGWVRWGFGAGGTGGGRVVGVILCVSEGCCG